MHRMLATRLQSLVCTIALAASWAIGCSNEPDPAVVDTSTAGEDGGEVGMSDARDGDAGRDAATADTGSSHVCLGSDVVTVGDSERESARVGDVSGDGAPDTVRVVEYQDDSHGLRIEEGLEVELADEPGRGWGVVGADLDGDGQRDLVVGDAWASEVAVFLGPIEQTRTWAGRDILFRGQPEDVGGLANLFGTTLAVGDMNGDSVPDLLVTAPGEAEEACAGQAPPTVYLGPFSKELYTRSDDADVELAVPDTECVGERLECREETVVLYPHGEGRQECYPYAVPLPEDAEPNSCSD